MKQKLPMLKLMSLVVAICCVSYTANAQEINPDEHLRVEITQPFIELHSGPANGYPVFHVMERGQSVYVLVQRTNWYKVLTDKGISGWVSAQSLGTTKVSNDNTFADEINSVTPFHQRDFEFGVSAGMLEGSSALGANVSWQFTETLSASINYDQALGDVSENRIATINISHQPFKQWSYSPYFSLGAGIIDTKPRTPLIGTGDENRRSDALTFSVGIKKHLMRNFIISIEYKNISALTNRDETEELEQWTTGFSVYF